MKHNSTKYLSIVFVFLMILTINLSSQVTFNINTLNNPAPGYLFVDSESNQSINYYNNIGNAVFSKIMGEGLSGFTNVQVQGNNVISYNTSGSYWIIMDKSFNIVDSVTVPLPCRTDFHEIIITPSGHYIILGSEEVSMDLSHIVTDGRADARVVNFKIFEIDQSKRLLHTWSALDHYNILDATNDVDLTNLVVSPFHINSLYLDADGNLIISARFLDEVSKINLSTGQFIWRMGGTRCANNQFTFNNDTYQNFTGFSHQHNVHRLSNGNLVLFDNGNLKPTLFSRAVEYELDETTLTVTKVWAYSNTPAIFAYQMGSVQRFSNGNTLINWGGSTGGNQTVIATEVDENGNKTFEMSNPTFGTYRIYKEIFNMDSKTLNISSIGTYDFNDNSNKTDIKIEAQNISGSGLVWVQKHNYEAASIEYFGNAACMNIANRWVIYKKGISNLGGKLYLSMNNYANLEQKDLLKIYYRPNEGTGKFNQIGNCIYDQTTNSINGNFEGFGEYILSYSVYITPEAQLPENDSKTQPINPLIKWKKINDGDLYTLQLSTDASFNTIIFDTSGIIANQYQMGSILSNNIKYYWRVKAVHSGCESSWSTASNFTTIVGTPTQVYPANNSKDILTYGKLIWSAVSGGENYHVQVSELLDFSTNSIDQVVANLLELDYNNLKTGVVYFWRVCASHNGVYGKWSQVTTFKTVLGRVTLSNPANTIGGIPVNGKLSWTKVLDATIYRIQVAKDTNFYNPIIDQAGLDTLTFAYSSLENYTTYYWRVRAGNDQIKGEWSAIWNFKTEVATPVLVIPANNGINVSPKATLNWEAVPFAQNYEIVLSDKKDLSSPIVSTITPKTSIKTNDLGYEKVFYWKVRAKDAKYFGQWSEVKSFKTQPENILVAPNLEYPVDKSYKVPISPVLSWEEVFNASNYEIHISTNSSFTDTIAYSKLDTVLEFASANLKYNSTYYWRTRSSNSKAISNWSEIRSFTTKLALPTLLTPDNTESELPSSLKLIWNGSEGADFYYLQVAKDILFDQIIEDRDNLTSTLFELDNLASNTEYFWRVKSMNKNNESDWSEIYSFKVKIIADVKNTDNIGYGIISPNPATDYIEINTIGQGTSFLLYDIAGNLVMSTNELTRISIYTQPSGVYNYIIINGKEIYKGKLSIIH